MLSQFLMVGRVCGFTFSFELAAMKYLLTLNPKGSVKFADWCAMVSQIGHIKGSCNRKLLVYCSYQSKAALRWCLRSCEKFS